MVKENEVYATELSRIGYRLWSAGDSDSEIAARVGCSRIVVRRWRAKVGLKPNSRKSQVSNRLDEVAHRMWLDGMTDPQIATEVGCSKGAVFNWRFERGLEANGGHGTPQRAMAFKSRLESQRATVNCWEHWLTDKEAADELGITPVAYTQRRNRLGLPSRRKMKRAQSKVAKRFWGGLTEEEKASKLEAAHEARRKVGRFDDSN